MEREDLNHAPLGLGLADAVITRLGSLNRFIVRPTSAVRQFDQAGRDPLRARKQLGVEAVLDATIQAAGNRIRLNAQLVRVRDGSHLWADTIDLERADLFTLEDELSSRLVRSLFGETVVSGRYRPKPEAFRLYTVGQFYRNGWTPAARAKRSITRNRPLPSTPRTQRLTPCSPRRGICSVSFLACRRARPTPRPKRRPKRR